MKDQNPQMLWNRRSCSLRTIMTFVLYSKKEQNVVKCRSFFAQKTNSNSEVYRHEVRLVAVGYSQIKGVDWDEVLTPVFRFDTLRFLLSYVAWHYLELYQFSWRQHYFLVAWQGKCSWSFDLSRKKSITKRAEFAAESSFENLRCRVKCLKFLYFVLPYSLLPTGQRNFFQIRTRQGMLTHNEIQ